MAEEVKRILKQTPLYTLYSTYRAKKAYSEWLKKDASSPPPHIAKQKTIREYARRYGLSVLVETGTYLGAMVEAMKRDFEEIISIELSEDLYHRAKVRFDPYRHITILQGDSGKVLKNLLPTLQHPCLFWLDGHYSEGFTAKGDLETPIMEELTHISNHSLARQHVILVDDARCFTDSNDYPALEQVKIFVSGKGYDIFEVKHDIIRIRATQV